MLLRLVLCASPRYLAKVKVPAHHPRDLAQHRCLRFTGFSRVPEWNLVVDKAGSTAIRSLRLSTRAWTGLHRPFMSYQVAGLVAERRLRLVLDE